MRQSQLFTKTRREAPADETAKNAQLLVRAGYIHKEMAGVYDLLPLGLRVVEKIKGIISEEMKKLDSEEISMTTLQNKEIWKKTDRWKDENVDVWFKSNLKTGGEVGFGWSHEEPITEMIKSSVSSYNDLPRAVHQFQTKLRNEIRAKSGIIRCREFLMKDMYYFARNEEENVDFYKKTTDAYINIFKRIGLGNITYITSASGGLFTDKFSHEFQTICETGEDNIYVNKDKNIAVNEEIYNEETVQKMGMKMEDFEKKKAAEVGNIFNFGSGKCEQMGLYFTDKDGAKKPVHLSSYGIGVTRLMGVLVEVFADEKGLIWPESISPFKHHIIEIISENPEVKKTAQKLYENLGEQNCLYDDRNLRAGEKFADADLVGLPYQIIISEKNISSGKIEVKSRKTEETKMLTENEILSL
jgi:prolyl-tRNA synthetase